MEEKYCRTCESSKPVTDFGRNKQAKDSLNYQCRDCVNQRMRDAYARDPKKKYALTRQYHLDHPEWSKERLRASHVRNREKRAQRAKERGLDPQIKESRRDATRRSESRRRAFKAGTTADVITAQDYAGILEKYQHLCWICGVDLRVEPLHWDHYQPLSKGGNHIVQNLRPACGPCNVRKNATWPFTDTTREEICLSVQALRESRREVVSS